MMKEHNQINSQMMQSLNQLQKQAKNGSTQDMKKKVYLMKEETTTKDPVIQEGETHRHHSPPYLTRNSYVSEDSIRSPEVSHIRHQRRIHEWDGLQGDLRKLRPPSFDGEREREI
jgi:hypothetical protein